MLLNCPSKGEQTTQGTGRGAELGTAQMPVWRADVDNILFHGKVPKVP